LLRPFRVRLLDAAFTQGVALGCKMSAFQADQHWVIIYLNRNKQMNECFIFPRVKDNYQLKADGMLATCQAESALIRQGFRPS